MFLYNNIHTLFFVCRNLPHSSPSLPVKCNKNSMGPSYSLAFSKQAITYVNYYNLEDDHSLQEAKQAWLT